mgnify:CR=1 FL=1
MTGTTIAFVEIEILVYFSYLVTIVLLVFKSNFKNTGIDNSEMFEDTYMSYLVNKIVRAMVFKEGHEINRKFTALNYVDKQRTIKIENITIKVKLPEKHFKNIKSKLDNLERERFVDEENSIEWIEKCVVGNITKGSLDKQR